MQRKRFEECAQNLTFHVGRAKVCLWLRLCRKFALQNVGGSEWVRSQNRLCAWRCTDWNRLHESSYCYFKVYEGARNLKSELSQRKTVFSYSLRRGISTEMKHAPVGCISVAFCTESCTGVSICASLSIRAVRNGAAGAAQDAPLVCLPPGL